MVKLLVTWYFDDHYLLHKGFYCHTLADNDKAAALNELGRMFSLFGDRSSACHFFRQSALLAGPESDSNTKTLFPVTPSLVNTLIIILLSIILL